MGKSGAERQRDLQAKRKLALDHLKQVPEIAHQIRQLLVRLELWRECVPPQPQAVVGVRAEIEEQLERLFELAAVAFPPPLPTEEQKTQALVRYFTGGVTNDAPAVKAPAAPAAVSNNEGGLVTNDEQVPVTNKPRKVKGGLEIGGTVYTLNVDSLLRDGQHTDAYVRRQGSPSTGGTVWAVGLWRRDDVAVTTHPTRADGIAAAVALLAAQS